MTVRMIKSAPLFAGSSAMPGRVILAPHVEGWASVAITEWTLDDAEWTDSHPFDEINYVLNGTLYVESDGTTVTATTGDTVVVAAGSTGRYWAHGHARMLAVYGPNPQALDSHGIEYRRLPQPQPVAADAPR